MSFGHGCHFPAVELGCDYGDYERAKELGCVKVVLRKYQGLFTDYYDYVTNRRSLRL